MMRYRVMRDSMKKQRRRSRGARKIEIPEDYTITEEEYADYFQHAKNSSLFYLSRYDRNSNEIRQKLYEKGYPEGEVTVRGREEETRKVNMVEDTIDFLIDTSMVDDENYVEYNLLRYLDSGKGLNFIKRKLVFEKRVDPTLWEETLERLSEEIDEKTSDSIERVARQVMNRNAYRKKNEYDRRGYLYQFLARRGFNSGDITEWIQNNEEHDD